MDGKCLFNWLCVQPNVVGEEAACQNQNHQAGVEKHLELPAAEPHRRGTDTAAPVFQLSCDGIQAFDDAAKSKHHQGEHHPARLRPEQGQDEDSGVPDCCPQQRITVHGTACRRC